MKAASENPLKKNLYFQFFFWTALFLFGTARSYSEYEKGAFHNLIIYNFCHWIFQIAGANFIYYVLVRKFLDTKKYLQFSLYFLICIYLISVVNKLFIVYGAEPFFMKIPQDSLISIFTDIGYLLPHYSFPIVSGTFMFTAVMFFIRYKDEKENTLILQKEKAELELKSLKSQLNPHFLFNTLNNIYSLSLIGSEKTSESINRLAHIFDYILYKAPKNQILISEELAVIGDYIALESLRYHEGRLKITQTIQPDCTGIIPPLIYLTLVENAFKHSSATAYGQTKIRIEVQMENGYSIFRIENTCQSNRNTAETQGIGLQNIEQQLRHHYQSQFVFNVSKENNIFKAEIKTPPAYD
ncbi:histidine kinase [Chryseobacterium sp. 2987]|uniref:sensor histidine kinase n=1 Tax=Chryseobacterium sp. 2987 TaxID=2817767 RepID=UPI0028647318|nr:histidine kinase [Chryseobacterium sp. 2987]MDR6919682.1 hypothetical protein [Chryseobacterium sp. 2987]